MSIFQRGTNTPGLQLPQNRPQGSTTYAPGSAGSFSGGPATEGTGGQIVGAVGQVIVAVVPGGGAVVSAGESVGGALSTTNPTAHPANPGRVATVPVVDSPPFFTGQAGEITGGVQRTGAVVNGGSPVSIIDQQYQDTLAHQQAVDNQQAPPIVTVAPSPPGLITSIHKTPPPTTAAPVAPASGFSVLGVAGAAGLGFFFGGPVGALVGAGAGFVFGSSKPST